MLITDGLIMETGIQYLDGSSSAALVVRPYPRSNPRPRRPSLELLCRAHATVRTLHALLSDFGRTPLVLGRRTSTGSVLELCNDGEWRGFGGCGKHVGLVRHSFAVFWLFDHISFRCLALVILCNEPAAHTKVGPSYADEFTYAVTALYTWTTKVADLRGLAIVAARTTKRPMIASASHHRTRSDQWRDRYSVTLYFRRYVRTLSARAVRK